MPFNAGVFIWDTDVFPLDDLPDDERIILHFRQKQEFKGQRPYGVVTLRQAGQKTQLQTFKQVQTRL